MDWQSQLITIYLYVCQHYREGLKAYCQRLSNYADFSFINEEVITVYLFRIINERTKMNPINDNTNRHCALRLTPNVLSLPLS